MQRRFLKLADSRSIKHKGPAQNRVLDNDVILLRKVDFKKLGGVVGILQVTNLRPGTPEGDMPWFLDGYVAAEQPRDIGVSRALLEATEGFAIARTDSGEIIANFKTSDLVKASRIAQSAKAELAVNIMVAAAADTAVETFENEGGSIG